MKISRVTWWHYAILVLALLLLFSIWAVPMRGYTLSGANDTFFATLGSIMGAIFTAAGLLIGIIALITLTTVDAKARDAAREVLQNTRSDIDADLTKALTAYDDLLAARNSIDSNNLGDLRDAERLVESALKQRPDLPNAREWAALTLSDAAFRYFLIHHFNDGGVRGIPIAAGSETNFNTNVHGAIRWLREIIERTTDESKKIEWKTYLATAYGLTGLQATPMTCY